VSAFNTPPPGDGILLFVHGYLDSAEAWRRVIDHLDKSFRSVALEDLEPAADSRSPAATLDSYAAQVLSKVGGAAGSDRRSQDGRRHRRTRGRRPRSFLVKAVARRFDAVRVHRINGAGRSAASPSRRWARPRRIEATRCLGSLVHYE
jgi:hypothetical protein